jgi:hypothetical protein
MTMLRMARGAQVRNLLRTMRVKRLRVWVEWRA